MPGHAASAAAIRAIDATVAAACAGIAVVRLLLSTRPSHRSPSRGLLVLDAAYTLDEVLERNLVHSITSRDLGGFFEHVWSVHPMVGASDGPAASPRQVRTEPLAPGHTFIEGSVRGIQALARFPLTDFVLAQAALLRTLARLLQRENVSVVRVGDPYYQGLLGLLLSRWARLPLVIRINGNYDAIYRSVGRLAYPRLFKRRWVEKLIDRFVIPRAHLVAGANQDNLQYAIDNGADPERTAVFRYGNLIAPVHWSDPSSRPQVAAELGISGPYIVCVSRLEPVKHVDDVVEVLRELSVAAPGTTALLIGDGSQREVLEQRAEQYGLGAWLVLAGNRDQDWVASALAHASVVLSPMTGRALVEAGLSGRPIVAYDVEWHAELVEHESTGYLIPYRDVPAMAAATVALLQDERLAACIGRTARERTAAMMDPATLQEEERRAYLRILTEESREGAVPHEPTGRRWNRDQPRPPDARAHNARPSRVGRHRRWPPRAGAGGGRR